MRGRGLNLSSLRYDERLMIARRTPADDAADRRLLMKIAARDRLAFEQFYRLYAGRVLAFVRDIVSGPELAEEVAGDAMVAVWNAADRFAGHSRVITWVLGIAHHKALDALRRQGVTPHPLELDARSEAGMYPEDPFARIDDRLMLDLALAALSAEHRLVLALMFGFDCAQAEIAEIVGCSVATVKTRVFYAKRRLRDEIERMTATEELA